MRVGAWVLAVAATLAAITIAAAGCNSDNSNNAGPGVGGTTGRGGGGVPSVVPVGGAGGGVGGGGGGGASGAGVGGAGVGGATGAGGQGQPPVCQLPGGTAGRWVEVSPSGQDGFRVTDAFAVGTNDLLFAGATFDAGGTPTNPRVLRWTQGCWTVELVMPPSGSAAFVPSVHGTGANDLWATGGDLLFHRDAQGWSRFADESWRGQIRQPPAFARPVEFHRVRAAAPNDVWAAISSNVLHWNGQWTAYNFDDPDYPTAGASIGFDYRDIWIDAPNNVWVGGASDQVGNTMDASFVHHFDGASWTHTAITLGQVDAIWRGGPVLWLANPGPTVTMQRFDGTTATGVPMLGMAPGNPPAMVSLFGRGASDIWAAGDDVAHFDGQNWSLIFDAPAAARSPTDQRNTYVAGDAASVWLATPGPRFFRKAAGP